MGNAGMPGQWPIAHFLDRDRRSQPPAHFATPAHGRTSPLSRQWNRLGVGGIELADLPYIPKDVWLSSERAAADAYGTAATYYFPAGTTYAVLAGIHAAFSAGDRVLVARNVHVSVFSALALVGATIVWLLPEDPWFAYTCADISKILAADPEISGLVLTNPSYEGHGSDIPAISKECRARSIRLVIDESLGAHWIGRPGFPVSALRCTTDMVFHSLHKRVGALVPSALLHLPAASSLDRRLVDQYVTMFRSTSPSNLVLRSTELAIVNHFARSSLRATDPLLHACHGTKDVLRAYQRSNLPPSRDPPDDPATIHFLPKERNPCVVADAAYDLGANYEHADSRGITYMISPLTSPAQVRHLGDQLLAALKRVRPGKTPTCFSYNRPDPVLPPHAALRARTALRRLGPRLVGRIAAELIASCPPGIPLLMPGERIQPWHCDVLGQRRVRVVR